MNKKWTSGCVADHKVLTLCQSSDTIPMPMPIEGNPFVWISLLEGSGTEATGQEYLIDGNLWSAIMDGGSTLLNAVVIAILMLLPWIPYCDWGEREAMPLYIFFVRTFRKIYEQWYVLDAGAVPWQTNGNWFRLYVTQKERPNVFGHHNVFQNLYGLEIHFN